MKLFEYDNSRDIPFYRHNPKISKIGWRVLLLSVPASIILYIIGSVIYESEIIGGILFCLTMLIPLLYFSKWNYRLIFQKPTGSEITLAVVMFLGYIAYALIMGSILDMVGLAGAEATAEELGITLETTIGLIFSLMGEELLKFIPMMFLMRVVYKFSENRKLAIALSVIPVLIGFGLMHYVPYESTLASVLLLQGLGTMFEVYRYLKTKNLFVPYLSHLLTDATLFIISLLVFA